jgi:phage baseplate assembly protein gpV
MREPLVIFGKVKDTKDPDGLNRVQVELTGFGDSALTLPWLRLIQPTASNSFGHVWLPETDDEVVILKGAGSETAGMVILGSLYNGANKPKTTDEDGKNNIKQILTRSGHDIKLDDTDGSEVITITASGEKLIFEMDVSAGTIKVTGEKEINLICEGEAINVDADKIAITGTTSVAINGDSEVTIEGTSEVAIKGTSKVEIKGGEVSIKGDSKVAVEGAQVEVKGSAAATVEGGGQLTLKGGIVNIN